MTQPDVPGQPQPQPEPQPQPQPQGQPQPRPRGLDELFAPPGPWVARPSDAPSHPGAGPVPSAGPRGSAAPVVAHPTPSAPAPAQPTPASPGPPTGTPLRPQQRRTWPALAGTATAAALVASLLTAGLTGAFGAAPATTAAVDAGTDRVVVPTSTSAGSPDWEAVAAAVGPSVVAIDVRTRQGGGQGSGVVLDSDGHVLTNDHVVGDAVELRVTLADGRVVEADLVGADPTTDLAVIRLRDATDLVPAELATGTGTDGDAEVVVGQPVMAVGNPLGLASTVTTGIVSALDRPVSTGGADGTVVTNAIQVDAAINPGNSGGPLFDAQGRVIGITSSIASMPNPVGGSTGSIGLGFAIPSPLAARVARDLVADGVAQHAFLGVALGDGTATADGVTRRGAVVGEVTPGSPAAEAGLRPEDVVVAIDGRPVGGAEALTGFVRAREVGAEVVLEVVRGGDLREVTATLAARG